jgi:hypothetical protein
MKNKQHHSLPLGGRAGMARYILHTFNLKTTRECLCCYLRDHGGHQGAKESKEIGWGIEL